MVADGGNTGGEKPWSTRCRLWLSTTGCFSGGFTNKPISVWGAPAQGPGVWPLANGFYPRGVHS